MRLRNICVRLITTCLLITGAQAQAGFLSTADAVSVRQHESLVSEVQSQLQADNVKAVLLELGVSPSQVNERVAALSDAELERLSTELEQLPAGGDALTVLGIVFLVLLVLEVVGVTDLFTGI